MLSVSDPYSVIDLLTARVEAAEAGIGSNYALPHALASPVAFPRP